MYNLLHTSKLTKLALPCLMLFGLLLFVSACGNSTTTTGSSNNTTTATQPAATDTSTTDTSGYGGRYGSGGSTTPIATAAVTGATTTITITTDSTGNFTFSPKTITIKVGTTIIWKNMTQTPHTVTSDDHKSFNSGDSTPVTPSATYSFKFTTAGTFAYHCDFHPIMTATVIVQ